MCLGKISHKKEFSEKHCLPTPNQLLITSADAGDIENRFNSTTFKKTMVNTFIGALLIPFCKYICDKLAKIIPDYTGLNNFIFIIVLFILVYFYAQYCQKHLPGLKQIIIDTALANADHTGVFLVTRKCETNYAGLECDTELLVENDRNKYIPYLDLKKDGCCHENEELNKPRIKEALATMLNLGKSSDIIHINELHSEDSIKSSRKKHNNEVKLMRYRFISVVFSENVENTIQAQKYTWKKLSELEKDPNAWMFNQDVITYIKELFSQKKLPENSFPSQQRVKFIWNIADTKKCSYQCPMCATNTENSESVLSREQKALVLCRILAHKHLIKEIDFTGADPLLEDEDRKIILDAISILGNEQVCVTTTGKGIACAKNEVKDPEKLQKLLYQCEISLDIDDLTQSGRKSYNELHQNLLAEEYGLVNQYVKNLIINVPIIGTDISEKQIQKLLDNIHSFPTKNKTVNLLRLMEVGKQEKMEDADLELYNDSLEKTVKIFHDYAKELDITVQFHCALRGLIDPGYTCNLRDEKIGIDSAGNVFSCAWGGYLKDKSKEENPFYLGNLLDDDLDTILIKSTNSVEKTIPAIKNRPPKSCCIYSYLHSENNSPYAGADPLFLNMNDDTGGI